MGLGVLLALTIIVTGREKATDIENALWTFILFAIGLVVSLYFGQKSVKDAAADVVRPQARGAARRLGTLGRGIRSFLDVIELNRQAGEEIAQQSDGRVPMDHLDLAYATLFVQIEAQMRTVVDALEDWREFEPEIVNELRETEQLGQHAQSG